MMLGIVLSDPRITYVIGATGSSASRCIEFAWKSSFYGAFPNAYEDFIARTRYRLSRTCGSRTAWIFS